eukprot:gene9135-1224_t
MKPKRYYPTFLMIFAFTFCGFGDYFLAINSKKHGDLFFMIGLLGFLVAQLTFTYMFKFKKGRYNESAAIFNIFYLLPFLMYAIILCIALQIWTLNIVLIVAVPFYALAICSMATSATTSFFANNFTILSFLRLFGSISFVASDSILAIGAFTNYYKLLHIPSNIVSVAIMLTYWTALYSFAVSFEEIYQDENISTEDIKQNIQESNSESNIDEIESDIVYSEI